MKIIRNKWKTNEHFAAFVSKFELANAEYKIDDLADKYFKQADLIHTKYFCKWRDNYLHLVLVGRKCPC